MGDSLMNASHRKLVALLAAVGGLAVIASAQLPRIGDVTDKLKGRGLSLSSLMEKQPITTSLSDARWGQPSMDSFAPPDEPASLATLDRTLHGGFVLKPGCFKLEAQSYCLKAGTHGPGGGDGYLFAPPKGPAEEAVIAIARNSVRHSEIPQHDIQVLLWAIIARAKFEDLAPGIKATASRLLAPQQLAMLNRSGLDAVPGPVMQRLLGEAPAGVRQVLHAEASLRQMMTGGGASYADLERVAVLTGAAPLGEGSRGVPSGRWSAHPDGYLIRYLPNGYSRTRIEICVQEGSAAVGKEFDPAVHVAVPGNTARQRLLQSARWHER
jgi:hypothetical protein